MSMRDKIEHAIQNQPCTVKELKQKFGGERGADRKVMEALDELVREAVVCQRQGVFFTVRSGRADKALLCKVVKLGKNFAFVMLEDGTSDIFIPGRFTKGAMPGDEVLVEKFEHPRMEGSDEGTILAVLTEKNDLVGTVRRVEGRLRFVPDDCPAITMPLARDCEGGAKDGDKVAVEILNRGNRQEDHRVGVAMRFGSSDEAKRCAKALLYAKDIRTRFPDKVREEAKKFEGAEISEKDCEGRMDLRALPIFTIDSAETKDIDDAVSLTRTSDGGFELGVHIADVSNYVKPGTELDNEAFSRATSVYYADQVVPMLPKALSNGICSLNENELRLAFSCLMRLDKDGNLTDYRFVKSIIRSRVKGVYAEINALLAGTADAETKAKYADVIDQLPAMKELYGHRARLRKERGCMDIESGEVKLILDENGRCIDVKKRTSGESESMIEEFMLLANQCAAHFARVKQIPFVYRVHEEPNAEKLERLHALLQACGINDHFAKEVPTPKELSAILEGVRGTPYEQIINTGMLRCMSKALYEEKPKGHYGLVLKDYAHFTSPIRRYPDLAIHRINDHFAKEVPTPKELSAILEGVRGTPYEQIINTGMLRCMSKALYEEKPKGHYGLVLKDYAHFTSPIRRYPDLAIHRIMTDLLKGTEKETMILRYTDFAERASKQSSEREVVAMQIERKAEDCYKAEYARRHLGECYEGTISGVTQRGLFIELDNGVEGFVPASSLTPSGTSLTEGVRLTDPASGKSWSLGDKMMITIVRADVNLGKIDFEVAPAAKN